MSNAAIDFIPEAWLLGKIQLASALERGIFIDLVARAWRNGGTVKIDDSLARQERVQKATLRSALETLSDLGIIKITDDVLSIKFVSEQLSVRDSFLEKQREFGRRGGRGKKGTKGYPKVSLCDPKATLSESKKEESIKEETKESINNPPVPPLGEARRGKNSSLAAFASIVYRKYPKKYMMTETEAMVIGAVEKLMSEGKTESEAKNLILTKVEAFAKYAETVPTKRIKYITNSYQWFKDERWREDPKMWTEGKEADCGSCDEPIDF